MADHDKKPPDYDPPNIGPDNGGFQPQDPFHIPGTDWGVQPFVDPFADEPSPYQQKPSDPPVPGGTPSPPSWWKEDPPDLSVPDNPFTPEAQQKIKDKHAREDEERRQREQQKKDLEDQLKNKPADDKGDFPEHQGDEFDV